MVLKYSQVVAGSSLIYKKVEPKSLKNIHQGKSKVAVERLKIVAVHWPDGAQHSNSQA